MPPNVAGGCGSVLQTLENGQFAVKRARNLSSYLTIDAAATIVVQVLDSAATLDRAFRALADPSRRQIVDRLAAGPASVSELARPLPITLAAVVQHVQVLEASGLVESRKTGRVRTCSLNQDALRAAEQWLADRRSVWERRLDRLGAVLDEPARETDTPTTASRRSEDH